MDKHQEKEIALYDLFFVLGLTKYFKQNPLPGSYAIITALYFLT